MKKLLLLFAAILGISAVASAQTSVYQGTLVINMMGETLNPDDDTLYDVALTDNGNNTCDLKLADFGLPALELKLGDIDVENVAMTTAADGTITYKGSKAGMRLVPEGGTDEDAIVADVKCDGTSKDGVLDMLITVEWIMNPTDPDSDRVPIEVTFKGKLTSGIAAIAADSDAPVYYNLQGIRVAQPTSGLYIKVAGGKTTKVAL